MGVDVLQGKQGEEQIINKKSFLQSNTYKYIVHKGTYKASIFTGTACTAKVEIYPLRFH